jgi:hypothetical protein
MAFSAIRFIEDCFGKDIQKFNLHLDQNVIGLGVIDGKTIAKLVILQDGTLNLNICTIKGAVQKTFLCLDANDHNSKVWIKPLGGVSYFDTMHFMKGHFYFITPDRTSVLRIDESGKTIQYYSNFIETIRKMAVSDGYSAERMAIHGGDTNNILAIPFGCQYFRPDTNGFNPRGDIFERARLQCMLFTHNGLIVTFDKQVRLYNTRGISTPRFVGEFELEEKIIDVFKGPSAHQVGFLTKKGKVLFYEIGDLGT